MLLVVFLYQVKGLGLRPSARPPPPAVQKPASRASYGGCPDVRGERGLRVPAFQKRVRLRSFRHILSYHLAIARSKALPERGKESARLLARENAVACKHLRQAFIADAHPLARFEL